MNSLSCNRRIVPGLRAHPESKRSSGFFSSARHARLRSLTVPLMGARVQVQRVSQTELAGVKSSNLELRLAPLLWESNWLALEDTRALPP